MGVPVGEVEEAEIVLWEEWGPRAARVISPPTFHWITAHAGRPWLFLDDKLVIRDFSTARVLGSREARDAGTAAAHHILSRSPAYLHYYYNNNAGKNEDGGATVLVLSPAQTRIRGHHRSQVQSGGLSSSNGTCFGEDAVTELPFIETRVQVRGRAGDMVLTDGERLISFIEIVKLLLERDADIQ